MHMHMHMHMHMRAHAECCLLTQVLVGGRTCVLWGVPCNDGATMCVSMSVGQARPCLRATIHKTEVRGPKTQPFVVYILHIRTAFTVRGLARRYSHFLTLDASLRAYFAHR